MQCGLDGSNLTNLIAPGLLAPGLRQQVTQLYLPLGGLGDLYFAAVDSSDLLSPFSLSLSPGSSPLELYSDAERTMVGPFLGLAYANGSDLYFVNDLTTTGLLEYDVHDFAIYGVGFGAPSPPIPQWIAGKSDCTLYASPPSSGPQQITALLDTNAFANAVGVVDAGCTEGSVTQLDGFVSGGIIAGDNAFYIAQQSTTNAQCAPGIYSVNIDGWNEPSYLGGRPTLLAPDPTACSHALALDAANVYWIAGCASGPWTLHGVAR